MGKATPQNAQTNRPPQPTPKPPNFSKKNNTKKEFSYYSTTKTPFFFEIIKFLLYRAPP